MTRLRSCSPGRRSHGDLDPGRLSPAYYAADADCHRRAGYDVIETPQGSAGPSCAMSPAAGTSAQEAAAVDRRCTQEAERAIGLRRAVRALLRRVAHVSRGGQATRRGMPDDGQVPRTPRVLRTALAVVLVSVLSGCTGSDAVDVSKAETPGLEALKVGPTGVFRVADRRPAPKIAGTTLDGAPLDVADMRGKIVVVNFWASWCAPCRAESDDLVAVAERYEAAGVEFVGVAFKDDADAARAFERRQGVTYPSIFDQAGVVLTRFRTLAPQFPPSTILIDREGRIAGRFIGGVVETELDGPVQALVKET